jgi:hypothetical protein
VRCRKDEIQCTDIALEARRKQSHLLVVRDILSLRKGLTDQWQ